MSVLGGIIAGAAAIGSSIYGGISSARQARKQKKYIKEQRKKNQDWYDRRYNEDATQRADAQALLARTEEMIRNRSKNAQGTAAVTGGTDESVAATKAANNEALANVAGRIAANADARKDQIEQRYHDKDDAYAGQLVGISAQQANNTAQAVQGVGSAMGNLIGQFGNEDEDNAKKATSGAV